MKILERYASAIHTKSLKHEERTTWADVDVLGAAGLAAKHQPLGIALARMLSGGKPNEVIESLTFMAKKRGYQINCRVTDLQARDIATAVLAWYRHGICQPCGGIGFKIITGTPSLGDACPKCEGTGKIDFDSNFRKDSVVLARWLSSEIDKSIALAGDAAMRSLANSMDML